MGYEVIAAMVIMAALGAGTTAVSVDQQNDAAEVASESAKSAAAADYQAVSAQAEQVNKAANQEALKLKREALIERGRLIAAQSETAFIGNSPLRELYNQRTKAQEALGANEYNQANALVQNSRDMNKIYTTARSRYNEAKASTVNRFAAGLQIVTAGTEGAATGYTLGTGLKGQKKIEGVG